MMFLFIEDYQKLGFVRAFYMTLQVMIFKSSQASELSNFSVLCLVFLHKQDVFLSAKIVLGTRSFDEALPLR
jgi:hypothetical protein